MAQSTHGRPDQDARLLLQPADPAPRRLPADRRTEDRRAARIRVPVPPRDADAPAVDLVDRAGGHRHGPLGRARRLHRQHILGRRRHASRRSDRETGAPRRFAINFTPASLLDPAFEATTIAAMVRDAGLSPIAHHDRVHRAAGRGRPRAPAAAQVKALRRLGFGFAVDDAGAGYASFALVAALRPIDHQDRPRHRLRHRPRRCEAGTRRGVRVVRPAHRRQARRRGHRAAAPTWP